MMNYWLEKCNKIEKLNFTAWAKIKEGLKSSLEWYSGKRDSLQ
jgi:hypothetical protein